MVDYQEAWPLNDGKLLGHNVESKDFEPFMKDRTIMVTHGGVYCAYY